MHVCVCVFKVCHECLTSFRATMAVGGVTIPIGRRFDFFMIFFLYPQAIWCVFSGRIRRKEKGNRVQQMIEMRAEQASTHTQDKGNRWTGASDTLAGAGARPGGLGPLGVH